MKLRFTIRELFLLTLVCGLSIGWWIDRQHLQQAAAEQVEAFLASHEIETAPEPRCREELIRAMLKLEKHRETLDRMIREAD
jgi:hypothetical protein